MPTEPEPREPDDLQRRLDEHEDEVQAHLEAEVQADDEETDAADEPTEPMAGEAPSG